MPEATVRSDLRTPVATPRRVPPRLLWVALAALLALATGASLVVGASALGPGAIARALAAAVVGPTAAGADPTAFTIVVGLRLPRTLVAIAAGAGLGAAGAALQGMFRNPLADPTLIGVSSGAALFVAAAVVFGPTLASRWTTLGEAALLPAAGFAGALATTALLQRLATRDGRTSLATMLLAGIAVNAFAYAGIGLLTIRASNAQLRSIAFWNFGSVAGVSGASTVVLAVLAAVAVAAFVRLAPTFDALALGDREARHLGFDVERAKRAAIAWTALVAGAIVAACGVIAFVALVAPHVVRLLGGPSHRVVVPGAALFGAALLVAADVVARTALAPAELPIGVVTALVGAPLFVALLSRRDARRA